MAQAIDSDALLDAIERLQTDFVAAAETPLVFGRMLTELLMLTRAEFGFIGEVEQSAEGRVFRAHAWSTEESRRKGPRPACIERLIARVLDSEAPIVVAPVSEVVDGGARPESEAGTLVGVQLVVRGKLIGLFGLRRRELDDRLLLTLSKVGKTLSVLVEAHRHAREERRASGKLARSEERCRNLLSVTNDAGWDWNIQTGAMERTARYAQMLGLEQDELRCGVAHLGELVHPDDEPRMRAALDAHLAGHTERYVSEHRFRHRDGHFVWVLCRGQVVEWDAQGKPLRMIGTHTDISERKELEARLMMSERMASLGTMAAAIAHEINNPLLGIRANIEHLRDLCDSEENPDVRARLVYYRAALDEVHRASARIVHVVRGLKSFSSPQPAPPTVLCIAHVVDAALEMTRNELRHRATVIRQFSDAPLVRGDETALTQVFVNLLVNAAQSIVPTPDTHGRIGIYLSARDGFVTVEVVDTGTGIPEALLDKIFDPFFTTKDAEHGSGLGLYVTRNIVRSHGGDVEASSRYGDGTRVIVTLPEIVLNEAEAAQIESVRAPQQMPVYKVLVIDDDEIVLKAIVRAFGATYDLTPVSDAEVALKLLDGQALWDVVLCDLMMPTLTGIEMFRAAAAQTEGLAERFVFMTGGALSARHRQFLDEVGAPVVHKPFEISELVQLFSEVAARSRRSSRVNGPPN